MGKSSRKEREAFLDPSRLRQFVSKLNGCTLRQLRVDPDDSGDAPQRDQGPAERRVIRSLQEEFKRITGLY